MHVIFLHKSIMLKAYKYRIYPTLNQKMQFSQHFGCVRFVYNWGLSLKQKTYKESGKGISKRELQDMLVRLKQDSNHTWLKDVNSQSLLASLLHLHTAFTNFFQKRTKFPKFKKKYHGCQKYQCPQHLSVDLEKQIIHLPKIKNIRIKMHRAFSGKIKTCTIEKTSTNKYYISILVDDEKMEPIKTTVDINHTIGLDLGIKKLLTTSDGLQASNIKLLENSSKVLKKYQRRLSKKQKRSANRTKARKRLSRVHEKIKNQRLNLLHQVSSKLVYKNQATSIAIEDLDVKHMMKNKQLSRSIGDCGWTMFVNFLIYKTNWSGKNLIKINPWFASSKTCCSCGEVKKQLSLSQRIYHCKKCCLKMDRDLNAAINIKNRALEEIGMERSESKLVDHALTGISLSDLVIHGLKQEAATRT